MLKRQTSGSVVCPACGRLAAVNAATCPHCGRPYPGLWGFTRYLQALGQDLGFVPLIIGGCVLLYVVSLALDPSGIGFGSLFGMLSPSAGSLIKLGASGAIPVFALHRWWTVLSASWLHGSLLHILFNMLWVRQLAPASARLYGPGRMVLIYLAAGVTGFLLSSFAGGTPLLPGGARGITLGASASIFGLLGALVLYGRRTGSSALGRQAWTWALILLVFGFLATGVDNYAHVGGFAGGYAVARVLDPLRPERPDHVLAALVGLALSLLSIVVSVLVRSGIPT